MSLTMTRFRAICRGAGIAPLLACFVAPAAWQDAEAASRPEQLQAVFDCAKVQDNTARLACYDKAAGALNQAETSGDVVVVDKEQVRTARRQAFGFSLPSLSLFGSPAAGDGDPERLSVDLKAANRGGDGKWVMETTEGATWRQVDDNSLSRGPRAGAKMVIRKGALGSFFCLIDNQPGVRCVRSR